MGDGRYCLAYVGVVALEAQKLVQLAVDARIIESQQAKQAGHRNQDSKRHIESTEVRFLIGQVHEILYLHPFGQHPQ